MAWKRRSNCFDIEIADRSGKDCNDGYWDSARMRQGRGNFLRCGSQLLERVRKVSVSRFGPPRAGCFTVKDACLIVERNESKPVRPKNCKMIAVKIGWLA